VRIETERTGLSADVLKSHRVREPTVSTLIDETSESPATRLTGGFARSEASYLLLDVRLSKPVSSSVGGMFLTEPFRPFAGAGLIDATVAAPTT
jgi:hypothetical protein